MSLKWLLFFNNTKFIIFSGPQPWIDVCNITQQIGLLCNHAWKVRIRTLQVLIFTCNHIYRWDWHKCISRTWFHICAVYWRDVLRKYVAHKARVSFTASWQNDQPSKAKHNRTNTHGTFLPPRVSSVGIPLTSYPKVIGSNPTKSGTLYPWWVK